jgi:hypothetical protein
MTTLAPAFGQGLPTLDTVPTEYNHEVNAELLYDLGAALVKAGLGSPEMWQKCGGNAVVFAQHSIMGGIGAQRGDLLQRNVEYHLQVSDVLERDGYGSTLSNEQLAVTIECSGAGILRIGPAPDALEKEAEGLGAVFYWTLIVASGSRHLARHQPFTAPLPSGGLQDCWESTQKVRNLLIS